MLQALHVGTRAHSRTSPRRELAALDTHLRIACATAYEYHERRLFVREFKLVDKKVMAPWRYATAVQRVHDRRKLTVLAAGAGGGQGADYIIRHARHFPVERPTSSNCGRQEAYVQHC